MTIAPKPGQYIIGKAEDDGHEHIFFVADDYPDDQEALDAYPRDDYPRATTVAVYPLNGNYKHHAHTIIADKQTDETLICLPAGTPEHTHTSIRKVK